MGHAIIHAIPCHTLTALRLWNIIEMMCIKPRLVVVSKNEVVIIVLVVVIIVVIVVIVVVLIIVIVVIIIIVKITAPSMPGMHLTMRLVVAYWLLYDQSSPHCSLNSFPAIGLDEVEEWAAKAGQ